MPRWKKVALSIAAAFAIVLVGAAGFAIAQLDAMCGNQPLHEALSPDQRFKAVAFARDCGASTGFSTQVSIIEARESLSSEAGNVFIADTGGKAPAGPGGGPELRLAWVGSGQLRIAHHPDARIYQQLASRLGVAIEYVALRPSEMSADLAPVQPSSIPASHP